MGAPPGASEKPLLSLFFHLLDGAEAGRMGPPSGAKVRPPGALGCVSVYAGPLPE